MTPEEIEGNKVIAEFMELGHQQLTKTRVSVKFSGYWVEAEYHASWDWIHPVWMKYNSLMSIQEDTDIYEYSNWRDHCIEIERHIINNETPERAFNKLVESIKWYNSIKK